MFPKVIVSDLDRTLTGSDLVLDTAALDAIAKLRERGIKVVVNTGRQLEELIEMGLVERVDGIVAENGAIVLVPSENVMETRHDAFQASAKAALGDLASAFRWGRVIGSALREHEHVVAERLERAGVAHSLEFNAEELMLLPAGVDKATGAELCLRRLGLTAQDAWAIGDGENDVSMLKWAKIGVAPANAAPAARAAADVHVASAYSRAFVEVTQPLLAAPTAR